MFTVFFTKKELYTGEGCVEMDIPWQLCRTIGPLLSQRFPLASAKAQPMGEFMPTGIEGAGSWDNCKLRVLSFQ